MTSKSLWKKVNEESSAMFMGELAERWKEEKFCEDINDYKKVIEDYFKIKIQSMTKRPFGFKVLCLESKELFTIQVCFDRNSFYLKGKSERI